MLLVFIYLFFSPHEILLMNMITFIQNSRMFKAFLTQCVLVSFTLLHGCTFNFDPQLSDMESDCGEKFEF